MCSLILLLESNLVLYVGHYVLVYPAIMAIGANFIQYMMTIMWA